MATHIKLLIGGFLNKRKKEARNQERIDQIIRGVLSKETEKHIEIKKIHKGKIVLHSDSSSFSYEFNLKKEKVLEAIQKEFPKIKTIRIEIG